MTDRLKLRSDGLEWRDVEGEIVAADIRTSKYIAVNPSGAVLWPALAEGTTRGVLVDRLVEAFAIDRASAEADVSAFLASLAAQQLLEP